MVSNEDLAVLASYSNSEPCASTARIAPSTSPCERSCPCKACAWSVSSTRRAASQPSREPGLEIRGAADDLAGIAGRAFEQHIDGVTNHGLVEGRLLTVDQFLEPHQSLVHFSR